MAHKKAAGSTKNGRDSKSKRLGVKVFGNQRVAKGGIIIRQKGTAYHPSDNVELGADYTLYSTVDGLVHFSHKMVSGFTGNLKNRRFVSVIPDQSLVPVEA